MGHLSVSSVKKKKSYPGDSRAVQCCFCGIKSQHQFDGYGGGEEGAFLLTQDIALLCLLLFILNLDRSGEVWGPLRAPPDTF